LTQKLISCRHIEICNALSCIFGRTLIRRPGLRSAFRAIRGTPTLKMLRLQRQIFAIWLFPQFVFCIKILVIAAKSLFNSSIRFI